MHDPAPIYAEDRVRALITFGKDPATATYHAWVDYRDECAAYAERTGQPDPEPDVSGHAMARMFLAVYDGVTEVVPEPGPGGLLPVRTIPDTIPLPTETIGWEILAWTADYLRQPDGPQAGDRWRYTGEQTRIVLRWYAIDGEAFQYKQGTIRRLKGAGKDPIVASLSAAELCGPCRFAGRHDDGIPYAEPHQAPWIQVCAVSLVQTKNTMRLFPGLFTDRAIEEYGIDIGRELVRTADNALIEAVTSSPRALEGGRPTLVILNETHHWIQSNQGREMSEVIAGNVGKSRGGGTRTLEITNAPLPGEDSVAESTWHAWSKVQEGKQRDPGMYYDSVESPPVNMADPDELRAGILAARGDADWLDVDWIISTIYSGTMPRSRSQRMYLNQLVTAEDQLISPDDWDRNHDEGATLKPGDRITLGFDGGKSSDATALMAIRIEDRTAFPLGVWERPDGPEAEGWQVDRHLVDGVVRSALSTYQVDAFFADVAYWESFVDGWSEDYGSTLLVRASSRSAVGRDMRGGLQELTVANERLMSAIEEGRLRHNGDRTLRRHVLNARRRPNQYGLSFGKSSRDSSHKVDAYAAMLLADLARHRLVESGKERKPERTGAVYFF
ncbi:terminase [Streptomyces antimycoticus]|uniref:terminase n=1 Tax=Streptomyces antimycoticus TaxID=68175 RepID=UPI00344AF5B2